MMCGEGRLGKSCVRVVDVRADSHNPFPAFRFLFSDYRGNCYLVFIIDRGKGHRHLVRKSFEAVEEADKNILLRQIINKFLNRPFVCSFHRTEKDLRAEPVGPEDLVLLRIQNHRQRLILRDIPLLFGRARQLRTKIIVPEGLIILFFVVSGYADVQEVDNFDVGKARGLPGSAAGNQIVSSGSGWCDKIINE